jgi:hypothetical protein
MYYLVELRYGSIYVNAMHVVFDAVFAQPDSEHCEASDDQMAVQIRAVHLIVPWRGHADDFLFECLLCSGVVRRFPSNAYPTSRTVTNAVFCFLSITFNPSRNGTTMASHGECDSRGEPPARWRA